MACDVTDTLNCLTKSIQIKMANPKIKPLADRVVVEAAPAEERTAGGLIIPDTAKEKPQRGKVIAVGTGKKRRTDVCESWGYHPLW